LTTVIWTKGRRPSPFAWVWVSCYTSRTTRPGGNPRLGKG
jgi:hypothetical protein